MTEDAARLLAAFWPRLRRSSRPLLLLDYDGTLAPFHVDRQRALPYPGVRKRLAALLAGGRTRLVIVSGRPCADLLPLLGLEPPPELWGCHGWERRRPDGLTVCGELPPAAHRALVEAGRWLERQGWTERSEAKPVSLTLHWRGLAGAEAAAMEESARAAWTPLAVAGGLELHPFDGGLELRHPGRDKGTVVEELLAGTPAGEAIAYLGDDLTDEDAFKALAGRGVGILVRQEKRPSAADLWLQPPGELLEFLDLWAVQSAPGGKV